MKLTELKENTGFQQWKDREHISDLVFAELEKPRRDKLLNDILSKLSDEEFEALANNEQLLNVALDNYDYATDTGSSVYIDDADIMRAIEQMGLHK